MAAESLASVLLVALALVSLETLASYDRYTYQFILEPIGEITKALDDVEELRGDAQHLSIGQAELRLGALERFVAHYRADLELAGSTHPDATQQLKELERAHQLGLVEDEKESVDRIEQHVRAMQGALAAGGPAADGLSQHADALRATLVSLFEIDIQLGTIAQEASQHHGRRIGLLVTVVGGAGAVGALLLGLCVRRAIAPRVKDLVKKVRRFHEFGVVMPIEDPGRDELAVLNNALDIGFAAIAARDRDRERFMSVAAHELKTPISNIQGLSHAALARPDEADVRDRALTIIDRQAKRLSRLVEDLFLTSLARSGELAFAPSSVVLAKVVEPIVRDFESVSPQLRIDLAIESRAAVLIDATLVSHALWTLLNLAAARVPSDGAIRVVVSISSSLARVEIRPHGAAFAAEELETMFTPFAAVQYEGTGQRCTLGLYLCKEVARLHGGVVRAFNDGGSPVLSLELVG